MTKISDTELEKKILSCLHIIAPEVDLDTLKKDKPLRDQIDIDSLDFVRLIVQLHNKLGVDVPERDYIKLVTFDNYIEYFKSNLK